MIKKVRNIKIIALLLILCFSALFALKAILDILFTNDYAKSLTAKSLKVQRNKVYLFTTKNTISKSNDTINIPVENKSFPDSLCCLFHDKNEWKLKLSSKIRDDDNNDGKIEEGDTISNPLFPWCCTQEQNPVFFPKSDSINETILINRGVKFNYYSGLPSDRFSIKLEKNSNDYFLNSNLSFLGNTYPINVKEHNIFELNFCNYTDTTPNKYVFLFPFSVNNKPSRGLLNIQSTNIKYTDQISNKSLTFNDQEFEINNIWFELKNHYEHKVFYGILILYLFVLLISIYNIYRLSKLYHKLPHRNLIVSEQSYILGLRILFNCIVLLGFPLLLIKLRFSPNRLVPYLTLVLSLNINWVWLYHTISQSKFQDYLFAFKKNLTTLKISFLGYKLFYLMHKYIFLPLFRFFISSNFLLLLIISIMVLLKVKGNNSESLFGIPALHITKLLYVLLPFTLTNSIIKAIEKVKYVKNSKFNIANILTIFISIAIGYFSKDFATPIFTFLSLFLIMLLRKDNLLDWSKLFFKTYKYYLVGIFIILFGGYNYIPNVDSWLHSKVYRISSLYKLPNNPTLQNVDEQSKETIAQQLYLLKSSFGSFELIPNFNQVILPSWRSTFFSDYAVLWSFKIGSYPFLIAYFLILLFVSYIIVSLLIILNKKIPLHNGKMVFYNRKVVLIFNVLLSLFLIQYIYTFLSNLWVLPLTGQSPGVLCPSYFELGFHMILINALYLFIEKKQIKDLPDRLPVVYTKVKRESSLVIVFLFICSLITTGVQISRIVSLDNEMKWERNNQSFKNLHVSNTDSLEFLARQAVYKKDKIKFKLYHQKFYENKDVISDSFSVIKSFIDNCSNIDSMYILKKTAIQTNDNDLLYYNKSINYKTTNSISNIYYSGCPLKAKSINFDLQKQLNLSLLNWANKINADRHGKYQMVSGCAIVAKNDGQLLATSSYPFLFNENNYHLKYVENSISKDFSFKFKYHTVNDYINFSEYDQIPGSIVKPLLAYCGLQMLKSTDRLIQEEYLSDFLGNSLPNPAVSLFREMASISLDSLKGIYSNDFDIKQFYTVTQNSISRLNEKTFLSYSIGNQDKLVFKEIVQAFTRIKTGKKIFYNYNGKDSAGTLPLSMNKKKLATLQTAMQFCLTSGSASNVGAVLKRKGILSYQTFLAKTGTSEIFGQPDHNRTSSLIVVTDKYTIGVQLFGDLQNRSSGLDARSFFISIINTLIEQNILQRRNK